MIETIMAEFSDVVFTIFINLLNILLYVVIIYFFYRYIIIRFSAIEKKINILEKEMQRNEKEK